MDLLRPLLGLCLLAHLHAVDPVGSHGDLTRLEVVGASAIPASAVRYAVGKDLGLLLARQPDAPLADWLAALADGVSEAYRDAGFRDATATATVENGHVRLVIAEGDRLVRGGITVTAEAVIAERIRKRLQEQPAEDPDPDIDLDTSVPLWIPGEQLRWSRPAQRTLAKAIASAIRDTGLVGVTSSFGLTVEHGTARLTVAVTRTPTPLPRGNIVVTGLPDDLAERLRQWLDIPPDAPATAELKAEIARRLRMSGRYRQVSVGWEDEGSVLPAVFLLSQPYNQSLADLDQEANDAAARVVRRGRVDLQLNLRPAEGVPPPWEAPSRELARILIARDRLVARLSSGTSSLVIDASRAGMAMRALWSYSHGLAIRLEPGNGRTTRLVYGDDLIIQACTGEVFHLALPGTTLLMGQHWSKDPIQAASDKPLELTLLAGVSDRSGGLALKVGLTPSAVAWKLLYGKNAPTQARWEDDTLVLTRVDPEATIMYRFDRAGDVTIRASGSSGSTLVISMSDAAWADEFMPVLAAPARQASGSDLASVLEKGTAGLSSHPEMQRFLGYATLALRSGAFDLVAANVASTERFAIPFDARAVRRSVVPTIYAMAGLRLDALLSARLREGAWPRCLLRSAAMFLCNEPKAGARALQPLFADPDAGPIAFLVCATTAASVGFQPLADAFANQGLERCNAAGLAADARTLLAIAPGLLAGLADMIDNLAATEPDVGRAAALKRLSATCRQRQGQQAALEAVAAQATTLGLEQLLRQELQSIRSPDGDPPER